MKSEHTSKLQPGELEKLKERVSEMTDDELTVFRNGFDPDEMGFDGAEGEIE